jgi:hypothetical protein
MAELAIPHSSGGARRRDLEPTRRPFARMRSWPRSARLHVVVEPPANRVRAEVFEPHLMLAAALGMTEPPRRLETRRQVVE